MHIVNCFPPATGFPAATDHLEPTLDVFSVVVYVYSLYRHRDFQNYNNLNTIYGMMIPAESVATRVTQTYQQSL